MTKEPIRTEKAKYIFGKKTPLGRGAYASVYQGFIEATNEPVAIKVMGDVRFKKKEETYIKCGKREIEIFKQVAELPNVIKMIDYIDNENGIIIIMEFCEGGTLRKLLRSQKNKRFEESAAVGHLRAIALGLLGLHKKNIMHKDLNVENILLKEGRCVIADLGSAVKSKRSYNFAGAEGYIAPEIRFISEGKGYTKQVDIWTLGVILFEMLFSRAVYRDMKAEIVEEANLGKERFPKEPNISKDAIDLLDKMLTIDPKKRITIEGVINHPLLRLEGAPIITYEEDEEVDENDNDNDENSDIEMDEITKEIIAKKKDEHKEKKKNKKNLSKKAKAEEQKENKDKDREENKEEDDEDEEEKNNSQVQSRFKTQNQNQAVSKHKKANAKKANKNKKGKEEIKNNIHIEESLKSKKLGLITTVGLIIITLLLLSLVILNLQ